MSAPADAGPRVVRGSLDDTWTTALLMVLTFSTGAADAVGYLGLDKVFTGNMTGNVVILGMAVVPDTELPVLGPAIALVGFFIGAMIGGRCLRSCDQGWSHRTTASLGVVAIVFLSVAGAMIIELPELGSPYAMAVTALLAGAMGLQAAAARHVAIKDVTTVVVTSTLTGLASDSLLGRGVDQPAARRLVAVLAVALGALCGAALLRFGMWAGVSLSGVLTTAVVLIAVFRARTNGN